MMCEVPMGSKAAILVLTDERPEGLFRGAVGWDRARSLDLAARFLGGTPRESGVRPLDLAVWPEDGAACVASFPRFDVVCSRKIARDHPSDLASEAARLAGKRSAYAVCMESSEDWASIFAWSPTGPFRAVSMSPGSGVIEDVGQKFPFEQPFWNGQRPVRASSYRLPFHPIDLGNEALRHFFGFILEGAEDYLCVDPEEVEIPVFDRS
ncbi:DUF6928 family protein [Streptomyces sp. NPDC093250]|uniref:DUF6928 family protein n=1 Tax=Streptomyces sp. NPDC093250 TaxID=3366036 RepID=UPI0038030B3F